MKEEYHWNNKQQVLVLMEQVEDEEIFDNMRLSAGILKYQALL